VDIDASDEPALVEAWFTRWRAELKYVSDDKGCGCCVRIWDIDGPEEAIADLPPSVLTQKTHVRIDRDAAT
jgi:hypothetical protein